MNILVTGGAGYIGSVVTAQLIEAGYTVIVYDSLARGHLQAVHKDAEFVKGDISDKSLLSETFAKYQIEAVMHFAAYIEAGESMEKPELYFGNNSKNTLILLETMHEKGIYKFVFSSTAAVYGDPEKTPILEDAALLPTNAYGTSKLIVEQVLQWYHQIHGFSYAALRYFNACGATATHGEDHQPESHLIPLALDAATGKKEKLSLYGTDYPTKDGTCIRDYIQVSDLSQAHLLALHKLQKNDRQKLIYNLGSEKGFSNLEVLGAVSRVVGKKVPFEAVGRRIGDPAVLVASSQKIKKELGWVPLITNLEDMIASAHEWRKKFPEGYK